MMNTSIVRLSLATAAALALAGLASAKEQAINDTLNSTSSSLDWKVFNGACLTAGNNTGSIPACVGLPYYNGKTQVGGVGGRLPDPDKSGALRLSNGDTGTGTNGNNQTGSVVSNFTFGTSDGIQVTWTSVSYGGNNYSGTGADGIVFFLSDGTLDPTIGAFGGSLGYSCANAKNPSDGVIGGYIAVGIDEYGNFSNPGDNTDSGPGFHPGRIGVRGAGFTAWDWLSASPTYGKYYKGTKNDTAIQNTCATGYAYNYSGASIKDSTGVTIAKNQRTNDKLPFNYPLLYSVDVPAGVSLANQQATNMPKRGNAIPIVFKLKITSNGLLDFSYSANGGATQTVTSGLQITKNNGPLPAKFRFGFSSGTGGGSNVHEITCFKAEPADVGNTTAGANVQQGQVVQGLSQVFLAFYHPVNWWGSLTANALQYDAPTDTLSASATATWDGGCVITGGDCLAMTPPKATSNTQVSVQTTRNVLSYNGGGVAFTSSALSSDQLTALGTTAPTPDQEIDYLRGGRNNEQTNSTATPGFLRNRTSVLADIIDSSPVWVGAPSFDYGDKFVDKLKTTATQPEGATYAKFAKDNATRTNVVYVGSNDGMLHAFRAGTPSADGKSLADNDGRELLAYVPSQVINAINPASVAYDYSSVLYQHNFQVDGTPAMGDLYYGNKWHTWLVTGLGNGGHPNGPVNSNGVDSNGKQLIPDPVGALFALDITDPSLFAEANATSLVIGEWNSSTLPKCIDNQVCGTNLGQVVGVPLIRRLHDGGWGVIFGNGLNSKSGRAGIFILHVSTTGAQTWQYIDAGAGPGNGIVQVAAADLDGDHVTDFIYAGDVLGNLWRFDLTDTSSPAVWSSKVTKIFKTATGQPISTMPIITQLPVSGRPYSKLLVSFGTGQKLPLTGANPEVYATGTQSIYGIWDSNLSDWNATTTDTKYDAQTTPVQPVAITSLLQQTVTGVTGVDGKSYRKLSSTAVNWCGTGACGASGQMGWRIDLPATNEQVIYNPVQIDDFFVVNTIIPTVNNIINCNTDVATGFTMAPSLFSGGGEIAPLIDTTAKTDGTYNYYSGGAYNGVGTPTRLIAPNGKVHWGMEDSKGGYTAPPAPPIAGTLTPVTWTKVR